MIARPNDSQHHHTVRGGEFVRWRWLLAGLLLALPPAAEAQAPTLSQTGRWQGPYVLRGAAPANHVYEGAHLAVLKGKADTTRVLLYGQSDLGVWSFVPQTGLTIPKTELGIPATDVNFHGVVDPGHDIFCSGAAALNGRLVVVGGQYRPLVGTETAYEFNPLYSSPTETQSGPGQTPPWRRLENTVRGRWYATVTALSAEGKLLATSGTKWGYTFTFGGDTGTLQNDLRPLAMGNTLDWAIPIASGTPPSARKDHTAILAYDNSPYETRMVVFGGETGPGQKANDVLAQYLEGVGDSTSKWVPFTAVVDTLLGVGPSGRSRHTAVVYAPGSGNPMMIVYGGSDASGTALGDVWKLELHPPTETSDTGRWTRLLASSGSDDGVSGPGMRYGQTAIFDPGPGDLSPRMLVFGGRTSSTSMASRDVWALSLTAPHQWTLISPSGTPPDPREGHVAVADKYEDPVKKFRMVIFGGHNGTTPLAETWSLWRTAGPEDTWTWTQVMGTTAPPARWRAAANNDWHWDRMVVFGGEGASGVLRDDLWALDLGDVSGTTLTWSELTEKTSPTYPRPAARAGHTLVPHPLAVVERYPEVFHSDEVPNPPGSGIPAPARASSSTPTPSCSCFRAATCSRPATRPRA